MSNSHSDTDDDRTPDPTTTPRIVYCFDRDYTIDVNPHPDRRAVPLEWVRRLRDTGHPVWAHGNQALVDEAGIPGIREALARRREQADESDGHASPEDPKPVLIRRRERLRLIRDLHPDADRTAAVDDVDVSDVSGIEHHLPWDFVAAVEDDAIDGLSPPDELLEPDAPERAWDGGR